jgi:hypothetical protein
MALSQISDLWTPEIWVKSIREKQATFPSILNSGIAVNTQQFDEIATGAGTAANIPFFKDISSQDDEPQVENTAATVNGITADYMVAPVLNRVTVNTSTALAAQVSGGDVVGSFTDSIAARRLKQRNATLYALLRGAFNTAGASAAAAPLSSMRVDSFDESGTDATSDQTFNPDLFITGKALLGELSDELVNGALLLHPNVMASLERADKDSFQSGTESGLPFTISTYRGIPVFTSELLYRAGSSNGYVYNSFLFAKGVIAKGEKPQMSGTPGNPAIDVASLNYNPDVNLNNERIYDRTRHVMHLNGMKWTGTPSGQSATNTELATYSNWSYVFSTQNRAGVVCFRTNA